MLKVKRRFCFEPYGVLSGIDLEHPSFPQSRFITRKLLSPLAQRRGLQPGAGDACVEPRGTPRSSSRENETAEPRKLALGCLQPKMGSGEGSSFFDR